MKKEIKKENKIKRLKRRDKLIVERFSALANAKYQNKKKYTVSYILTLLADEFPPLSESYIEKIISCRVEYKENEK